MFYLLAGLAGVGLASFPSDDDRLFSIQLSYVKLMLTMLLSLVSSLKVHQSCLY